MGPLTADIPYIYSYVCLKLDQKPPLSRQSGLSLCPLFMTPQVVVALMLLVNAMVEENLQILQ